MMTSADPTKINEMFEGENSSLRKTFDSIKLSSEEWGESINSICVDAWANINDSLQKDGAKFKGDGIGTAYGGWTALCEIVIPRVKSLLSSERAKVCDDATKAIAEIRNR